MLKVNLSTGESLHFDLTNEESALEWNERARDTRFQQQITALTLILNGVQYSLPRPSNLTPTFLFAENIPPDPSAKIKGGERILAHAGDIGVVLTAHASQRALRVNVTRQGKQRFNPLMR